MQALIIIFLIVVGAAAAIVTFPWGIAIAIVLSILIFGMDRTVDFVKGIFSIIVGLAGVLIIGFFIIIGIIFLMNL